MEISKKEVKEIVLAAIKKTKSNTDTPTGLPENPDTIRITFYGEKNGKKWVNNISQFYINDTDQYYGFYTKSGNISQAVLKNIIKLAEDSLSIECIAFQESLY